MESPSLCQGFGSNSMVSEKAKLLPRIVICALQSSKIFLLFVDRRRLALGDHKVGKFSLPKVPRLKDVFDWLLNCKIFLPSADPPNTHSCVECVRRDLC